MNPIIDINSWIALLGGNLPDSNKRVTKVLAAYSEPHRRYHVLTHLFGMLNWLKERLRRFPDTKVSPPRLFFATLYHDSVFKVGAKDNEFLSAEWAADDLKDAGVSVVHIAHVVTDIMDTLHQEVPATAEGKLIVDADLISMAQPFEYMYANTLALMEESGQPPKVFAKGNIAFLESLLARPAIFRSPHMENEEALARDNIFRTIEYLKPIAA